MPEDDGLEEWKAAADEVYALRMRFFRKVVVALAVFATFEWLIEQVQRLLKGDNQKDLSRLSRALDTLQSRIKQRLCD